MGVESGILDVAIIGGGISGVYSAWRLVSSQPGKRRVALFEGSQRVGGRLLSATPPGMPGTVCEIGGMRYVSSQTLVRSLIENKLNLPRHEQIVDMPQNIAHMRGRHLRTSETTDPSRLPYKLQWIEKSYLEAKNDPSSLMGWAITQILPEVANLNGTALHQFLQSAEVDGVPLYHHGFWNLLARAMSSEAYQLSKTLIGYDCLGNNANAVDLTTCYFDFTPGVKYYLLDGGYETVPWILEEEFRNAGGEVNYHSWLEAFDKVTLEDGSIGVSLHFTDGRPAVTARAVVLAMPQHSIRRLRAVGPVLESSKVQHLLGSVQPIALYKMFIGYHYPWWEKAGVTQGRSFTDLPVRQCYYWANNQTPMPGPNSTNAMIMVYDDSTNVDFWGGLRMSPAKRVHFQRKTSAAAAQVSTKNPFEARLRQNWQGHEAPKLLVQETHRQLMALHNVQYAPDPVEAAYADWSDEPYGGAVHLWNRGYKSWELVDEITQPVRDFPCYICGEAFSTNQTWAEGALQTAEIVLQKRFGLDAPAWVTQATAKAGA
jgi:monoamine oxidase